MMTMASHSIHQPCSETLEMKIIEALENIGGTVESLVPQEDPAPPGGSDSGQNEVGGEHSIHRFQITFSAPCQESLTNFEYFENRDDSASPTLELQPQPNFMEFSGDLMGLAPPGVEEMSEHDYNSNDFTLYEFTDGELLELGAISPSDESLGLYPLSSEVLQQTIDAQLNRSVSPNGLEWSNNLFNDLTSPDTGMETMTGNTFQSDQQADSSESITSQLSLSPQQQSNEISSSSTWDSQSQPLSFVSMSGPSTQCNSTSAMSQFIPQEYFTSGNTSVSLTEIQQVNFNISSTQQQIFCPATLPAVSALMTAGGNGGSATTSAAARTVQSRQSMNGILPTLLLPKTAASTVASSHAQNPTSPAPAKQRARKTSPLSKDRVAAKPNEQLPTKQSTASVERSYSAWILQEGLIKSRQQYKLLKEKHEMMVGANEGQGEKLKIRYVCPVCNKSYGSANGIKYHAQYGHGPKSMLTCEFCNKEYASRHGLAAHRKNHEIRRAAEALDAERLGQIRK